MEKRRLHGDLVATCQCLKVLFCHKNLNDLNYRYLQFLLEDSQYQYGGVGTLEGTSVLPLGGSSVQK